MPVSGSFQKFLIIGPNVGMGGVERASCNVANGLVDLGHRVTYLALIPEEPFFHLNAEYIEPEGFNIFRMNFLKTIQFIRFQVKQLQPDAILCFTKFYAALVNFALIGTSYGIVISERSSPLYRWPFKIEFLSRISFWFKKPKAIISQTTIASQYHQKYYGKTAYHVIPNPVPELQLHPEIKREKIILAVGRFHDDCKGFDLLVQAFNQVKSKDWRLVFAGGTQEEGKYLLDLATEAKKEKIDFLGEVREMDILYARAGIFVMPSRSEGFPNALAEAMAAGCCCVSFDFVAGPRDIIEDGINGRIVPANNVRALAQAFDELIVDKQKRLQFQSKALQIREKLNQNEVVKRFEKALTVET